MISEAGTFDKSLPKASGFWGGSTGLMGAFASAVGSAVTTKYIEPANYM